MKLNKKPSLEVIQTISMSILAVAAVLGLLVYSVHTNKTFALIFSTFGKLAAVSVVIGGFGFLIYYGIGQYKNHNLRQMKLSYYHNFLEAYILKMSQEQSEKEDDKMNQKFLVEINCLPLYASQEVVEYLNKTHERGATQFHQLQELIRADIAGNTFKFFKNLKFDFIKKAE